MKDNRDPEYLGRQLRSLIEDGATILAAADVVEVYSARASPGAIPNYDDRREGHEPMCGFPPGGPRPPLPVAEEPSDVG